MTAIDPKVAATGLAGAATIVLVWLLHVALGIVVPGEVGASLTVLLGGVAGYFKKPTGPAVLRRRDRPLRARGDAGLAFLEAVVLVLVVAVLAAAGHSAGWW